MSIRIGNQIISSGRSIGVADSINNQNTASLITDVYNWIGTSQEYEDQRIAEEHPEWVCFITDDETHDNQEFELIAYTARNVGDIFYTSRSESWLNGAVECNGGIYQISDYSGEESVNTLLQNGNLAYLSIAEYDALIEAQGWCEKFGWDGIDAATFKVPTLTAKVVQENNIPVVGNGKTMGLTNGDYNFGLQVASGGNGSTNFATASYNKNIGTTSAGSGFPAAKTLGLTSDGSKSGMIADLTSDSANLRVMIQLSTGFNDESIETLHSLNKTVSDLQESKQDEATALNYNSITNCITHISQDIKLELNNGTLTLKAGSKLYVPNGFESDGSTPKFDTIITTDDKEFYSFPEGKGMPVYCQFNNWSGIVSINNIYSGSTQPTPSGDTLWYDTANNIVKVYVLSDGEWVTNCELPFGITTGTSSSVTSIDQVFNGFGYIGSTVFALPGVQVIVPAGKDLTGKPRSTIFTSDKVSIYTPNPIQNNHTYTLVFDGSIEASYELVTYNLHDNVNYRQGQPYAKAIVGTVAFAENNVTNLTNKATFQAVDYNDFVKYQAADHKIIEFMEPTVDNDYTWYRLYSDGWVEQGGKINVSQTGTVTLPITMSDSFYFISFGGVSNRSAASHDRERYANSTTTTGFTYTNVLSGGNGYVTWEVKGMAEV